MFEPFDNINTGVIMKLKIVFAAKVILFAAVMLMLIFQCVMPQYTALYNAAIIDKYDRLSSLSQPKIILVGDSNVAFGFYSELIEEAFDMPVVNFGLHGSLGQVFNTNVIKGCISEGDIIVIAPAGYHYSTDSMDCVMAWLTIENHFKLWRGIPRENYKNMLSAYPTYLKRVLGLFVTNTGNRIEDSPWGRVDFNTYGDYDHPRPECRIVDDNYSQHFSSETLDGQLGMYWNDYNRYVLSKNAVLYMSAPPILGEALEVDLDSMQRQLNEGLEFPMISKLSDYVYPLEYFYDTGFHMNDHGRAVRTQQLIDDLSAVIGR